jgi:acetyl esterase/lipase
MFRERPAVSSRLLAFRWLKAGLVACGLAWSLGALATPACAAGSLYAVRPVRDLAYFDGVGADPIRHKLDLYLPKGEKDFPVVVFVHGGAWARGDKGFLGVYEAFGTFLARHGIGAVVINYRLSPAVQHPEHIRDVARAFAWVYKHIASYGGSPDRIILCGHSAGGHLAALLVTDPAWLKAEGLNPGQIRGVISISGVYDLADLPPRFVSRTFGPGTEILTTASPGRQARAGLPPFLLLYADHDLPGCDKKPAEAFAKALREKGTKAEAREISGSNHYKMILSTLVEDNPECQAILSFIATHTGTP